MKIQKHIEIVRSSIPALSSLSQESCDAIYSVLKQHYETVGVSTVDDLISLNSLIAKQPDLVFLGMKYIPLGQHKIWLSNYLAQYDIAHTGSPKGAIEFEQNKALAKERVLKMGLRSAGFTVIKHDQREIAAPANLTYPLFVKPASLGGGQGIDESSVVYNEAEFHDKIVNLRIETGDDALVEEYLPGREFSIAVLKEEFSDELVAMPIELVTQDDSRGHKLLSQAVKSGNKETVLPVTDIRMRARINLFAIRVFKSLGARDYGRIDIRLDADGMPHFLEANLIPSLIAGYGSFPKACVLNKGLSYETMVLRIVRLGLMRQDKSIPQTQPTVLA